MRCRERLSGNLGDNTDKKRARSQPRYTEQVEVSAGLGLRLFVGGEEKVLAPFKTRHQREGSAKDR